MEHIGCANGQDCNGVMISRTSSFLLDIILSRQPCIFLAQMVGCQIGLLVSLSQIFTSCFFFFKVNCVNFGNGALNRCSNDVIIGLILLVGR